MRYAVVGGDRRSALLAEMLQREGHRVHSFALEKAELPAGIARDSTLQACTYGADCVLLPTPAERGGLLYAPLGLAAPPMDEVIGALWPGALVIGGGFAAATVERALREQLRIEDLMRRADFLQANAAITAEGAIGVLLRESEKTLLGSRCLVAGWGRIGKLLTLRLSALGAYVTAAARRRADRAEAEALGLRALDYGQLESIAGELDFVVNTVPARVLSDALLCCLPGDALLLELASPPGGFDPLLAQNIGLRALTAPGLPGKSAPASAAALLKRTAAQIMQEQEE